MSHPGSNRSLRRMLATESDAETLSAELDEEYVEQALLPDTPLNDFAVLSPLSLHNRHEQTVQYIAAVLNISKSKAQSLLISCGWNSDHLLNLVFENGLNRACELAGLRAEDDPSFTNEAGPSSTEVTEGVAECQSCFTLAPTFSLGCGHRFCHECWGTYTSMKVKEGKTHQITCMGFKCPMRLEESIIRRFASEEAKLIYARRVTESFVADNVRAKWCPSVPHCGNSVTVESLPGKGGNATVQCTCGLHFCFRCLGPPHAPTTCAMIEKWTQMSIEDPSMKWVDGHAKKCYQCNMPIEKNGGCDHMTCAHCGGEFCWRCRRAWRGHDSDDCASAAAALEKDSAEASSLLSRVLLFTEHWKTLTEVLAMRRAALEYVEVTANKGLLRGVVLEGVKLGVPSLFSAFEVARFVLILLFFISVDSELYSDLMPCLITRRQKMLANRLLTDMLSQLQQLMAHLQILLRTAFNTGLTGEDNANLKWLRTALTVAELTSAECNPMALPRCTDLRHLVTTVDAAVTAIKDFDLQDLVLGTTVYGTECQYNNTTALKVMLTTEEEEETTKKRKKKEKGRILQRRSSDSTDNTETDPITVAAKEPKVSTTSLERSFLLEDETHFRLAGSGLVRLPLADNQQLLLAAATGDLATVDNLITKGIDPNTICIGGFNAGSSALWIASKQGFVDIVRYLLRQPGIDVNRRTHTGATPLYIACSEGRVTVVEALLTCPDIEVNQATNNGATPLYAACENNRPEIVYLLLQREDILINLSFRGKMTPLQCACWTGASNVVSLLLQHRDVAANPRAITIGLYAACVRDHCGVAAQLLQHPAVDVNGVTPGGDTPLLAAADKGYVDIVRLLLGHPELDPDVPGHDGRTAVMVACDAGHAEVVGLLLETFQSSLSRILPKLLFAACERGHTEVVQKLLDIPNGEIDVNSPVVSSHTPLLVACREGHVEIVEMLLQHPSAKSSSSHCEPGGWTPFLYAVALGNAPVVELFLQQDPSLANSALADDRTALYLAATEGHQSVVRLLLQHSLDVNAGVRGCTPLLAACANGRVSVVQALLTHPQCNVNKGTDLGVKPLYVACESGNEKLVALLLHHIADPAEHKAFGITPLMAAYHQGNQRVIQLLLQHRKKAAGATSSAAAVSRSMLRDSAGSPENDDNASGYSEFETPRLAASLDIRPLSGTLNMQVTYGPIDVTALPRDALVHILSFLSGFQICRLQLVGRRWYSAGCADVLWRETYTRTIGAPPDSVVDSPFNNLRISIIKTRKMQQRRQRRQECATAIRGVGSNTARFIYEGVSGLLDWILDWLHVILLLLTLVFLICCFPVATIVLLRRAGTWVGDTTLLPIVWTALSVLGLLVLVAGVGLTKAILEELQDGVGVRRVLALNYCLFLGCTFVTITMLSASSISSSAPRGLAVVIPVLASSCVHVISYLGVLSRYCSAAWRIWRNWGNLPNAEMEFFLFLCLLLVGSVNTTLVLYALNSAGDFGGHCWQVFIPVWVVQGIPVIFGLLWCCSWLCSSRDLKSFLEGLLVWLLVVGLVGSLNAYLALSCFHEVLSLVALIVFLSFSSLFTGLGLFAAIDQTQNL